MIKVIKYDKIYKMLGVNPIKEDTLALVSQDQVVKEEEVEFLTNCHLSSSHYRCKCRNCSNHHQISTRLSQCRLLSHNNHSNSISSSSLSKYLSRITNSNLCRSRSNPHRNLTQWKTLTIFLMKIY